VARRPTNEPWAQDDPPTKSEMLNRLEQLWGKLSSREQDEREECYEKAKRYMEQAPAGGIAPHKKTFRNRKLRGGVRIDLEIETGKACIDDPA
jgi:hypothetical protein